MEQKMRVLLWISIALNVVLISHYFFEKINSPADRVGVLKQDVKVYMGKGLQQQFILPKGLVVRDASPRGLKAIDLFEPFHFQIILTTEERDLVDYNFFDKTRGNQYYPISSK